MSDTENDPQAVDPPVTTGGGTSQNNPEEETEAEAIDPPVTTGGGGSA